MAGRRAALPGPERPPGQHHHAGGATLCQLWVHNVCLCPQRWRQESGWKKNTYSTHLFHTANAQDYQWIGLNDKTVEDDFRWTDGTPLVSQDITDPLKQNHSGTGCTRCNYTEMQNEPNMMQSDTKLPQRYWKQLQRDEYKEGNTWLQVHKMTTKSYRKLKRLRTTTERWKKTKKEAINKAYKTMIKKCKNRHSKLLWRDKNNYKEAPNDHKEMQHNYKDSKNN